MFSTIRSLLSLNVVKLTEMGVVLAGLRRFRLESPPPMVRNPVGTVYVSRDELNELKNGRNHDFRRGNIMGRLVVIIMTKASLVPHSPASCPPLIGSCMEKRFIREWHNQLHATLRWVLTTRTKMLLSIAQMRTKMPVPSTILEAIFFTSFRPELQSIGRGIIIR